MTWLEQLLIGAILISRLEVPVKPWHVVVAVAVLAQSVGWIGTCAGRAADRKVHKLAWQSYLADSATWAARDAKLRTDLLVLRQDSARLARSYVTARTAAQGATTRLQTLLALLPDSAGHAALRLILEAGERCNEAWTNCEARATTEHERAELAIAQLLTADRAAADAHRWALAEIRHARAWAPFSLKPPSIVWAGALLLAGGVLLR